ncbi:MAG: two-component regulator propeller domain-containing protein [Candidatus Loosdrechtia sp.]|uniref:two-component regulator propeller domain-containing protein n=1 Tax=Candidatus Loosdrechtia sp. TaxID=3101272 RepID=UPI003A729F02|nr:MAG: hypothetical protein QY305_14410 [Candidatus Jettenia sp. AMX2]
MATRSLFLLKIITFSSVFLFSSHTYGTTTATWIQTGESESRKGYAQNITIHNAGEIKLSPQTETITGINSAFVWSMTSDGQNRIFVGTGDPGTVYLIKNGTEVIEYFKSPELYIQSLAVDSNGNLYVGTSPRGIIYKINRHGEATLFCNLPAPYIWKMAIDSNSNIFAATGNEGILYRISPDGTPSIFFDTPETHLLDVLIDQHNNVYVGTEPNGLVYKITPSGQAEVMYDASEGEIHCLAIDAMGSIYAGTASGSQSQMPATATTQIPLQTGSTVPPSREGVTWDMNIPEAVSMTQSMSATLQRPVVRSIAVPQKTANVPNIPNFVYKITQNGFVKKVFEIDQAFIIGMSFDQDYNLYVVTANNAGVHKIYNNETSNCLVDMTEEVQILCCLSTNNNEMYIGTGNMGKVYRISPRYVSEGIFTSNVLDTTAVSNWGNISWTGKQPEGTKISLATRSGNCEKPDVTWEDWSDPYISSGERITSRFARFIQYRAVLQTEHAGITPSLDAVSISYLPQNQPPVIVGFTIDKDSALSQKNSKTESKTQVSAGQKPHHQIAQKTIQWEVEDPNSDTVQLTLSYKGTDEKAWKILDKTAQKKGTYTWDTLRLPDGEYHIRLVASDEPDNPPETALSVEEITQPVVIDNSRPVIQSVKLRDNHDGRYVITGTAKDTCSKIIKVQYTIDGQEWISASPLDGLFDSEEEAFQIITKPFAPDNYTLIVNAIDSEGNIGAEKVMVGKE